MLNAANEIAVAAFLERRIRFDQIHAVNEQTLATVRAGHARSMEDLLALDGEARAAAAGIARKLGSVT